MIPVNRPHVPKNAKKYFNECVDTGWFSSEGPFVKKFEEEFAKFIGVKYAAAVNSGTTALHLALVCLGVGPGDEVILPASTIGSCYFAIWYIGAKAVPVDVDSETYTLTAELVKPKITKKTKVIMPVHLFGHPCDMDPLLKLAQEHNIAILEDAAEAHGAKYKNKDLGSMGTMACYSFYGNKIVTCGEGGMVVTNDPVLHEKAVALRNLNHSKQARFIHPDVGYKYVMTNMQGGLGLASLEEAEWAIDYKRKMAAFYEKSLKNTPGIVTPIEKPWAKSVYWMYAIRVEAKKFGMNRDELMKKLQDDYGIQTRSFFFAPNIAFKEMGLYQDEAFLVAEKIGQEGLYLPSGLDNTQEEFESVANALATIHKQIT